MRTERTEFQKYLWQDVRLSEGTFTHLNTRFYTVGISTQIRDQLSDLYDLDTEDMLGVIFAYTRHSENSVIVEQQVDSSGHAAFYDPRPSGNVYASTALMNILYNTGVKVTALGRDVFTIPLDSNLSVGTDSDNGTVFDECQVTKRCIAQLSKMIMNRQSLCLQKGDCTEAELDLMTI